MADIPVELRSTAKVETIRSLLQTRLKSMFRMMSTIDSPPAGWMSGTRCIIYPNSVLQRSPSRILVIELETDKGGTLLRGTFRPNYPSFMPVLLAFASAMMAAFLLLQQQFGIGVLLVLLAIVFGLVGQRILSSTQLNSFEEDALDFLRDVLREAEREEMPKTSGNILIHPRKFEREAVHEDEGTNHPAVPGDILIRPRKPQPHTG